MKLLPKWFATIIAAFVGVAATAGAHAQGLTSKDASAFAKCLPAFQEKGEAMDKAGTLDAINAESQGMMIVDGKMKMFSVPMARMKSQLPGAYGEFNAMAKGCGMGSAANFAAVGDRVFAAYMASKMPAEMTAQIAALTPDMMAMMPPAAQQAFALIEALENVPDTDKAALTPETVKALDDVTGFDGEFEQAPSLFGK
ncbi:MAG: hypothetical protein AAFO78_06240 [Pseudomonadota bacterium]